VFANGPTARCTPRAPATLRGDAGQGGWGWRVPERRGGGEAEEGIGTVAFASREGAPMARGSCLGAGTVGMEVVRERGGGAGSVTREWTSGGSAVFLSELGRWHD
jgi:hypothetical protein